MSKEAMKLALEALEKIHVNLDRDKKLAAMRRWKDAIKRSDALFEPIRKAVEAHPESNLCQSVYGLQEVLTRTTADLVGDGEGTLEWHWLENGMGKNMMEAYKNGENRAICTLEDVLWLME